MRGLGQSICPHEAVILSGVIFISVLNYDCGLSGRYK